MDLNIAKEKIINYNIKKEKEKQKKEEQKKNTEKQYIKQIEELKPRIKKIIDIGNLCIENNIFIGHQCCSDKRTYKDKCFETEGIKHQLGFYPNNFQGYPTYKCSRYEYIGIINGGICGEWDFLINEKEMFEVKQERDRYTPKLDSNSVYRKPTIKQMNNFVKQFHKFEKEFYNFIKNL